MQLITHQSHLDALPASDLKTHIQLRFDQLSEDEQLQLLERGSNTFVGTFNDRPYIAPFHGNIIELCEVASPDEHPTSLPGIDRLSDFVGPSE